MHVPSAPLDSPLLHEPLTTPGTLFGWTHARSRLALGISGVGVSVVGALLLVLAPSLAASLAIEFARWLGVASSALSLRAAVGTAVLLAALHALLLWPLDLLGGVTVVRRPQPVVPWLLQWVRGVLAMLVIVALSASGLYAGYHLLGAPGVVLASVVLQLVWFAAQGLLARAVGGVQLRSTAPSLRDAADRAGLDGVDVREVDVDDLAAVGGWIGLANTLWVPSRWLHDMPTPALIAQLVRRRITRSSGLRLRGVIGAISWNTIGVAWFALGAQVVPIIPSNVVLFMSGMTLWSFLGVLLLPTPSRRAVFAVDRDAARAIGGDDVMAAIRIIDAQQDDELERPRGVETIFHPVPSRGSREAALVRANPRAPRGAHHLTRLMLGASTSTLGLLGRAVHCNIGRPALWVVFPGD
jgi:hypothetical protein